MRGLRNGGLAASRMVSARSQVSLQATDEAERQGRKSPPNQLIIMSLLTKWTPFSKSEETDIYRPAMRWDPLRDMEDMMRGMQRALANWPLARPEESMTLAEWSPSVDIGENDQEFIVKAELPEVRKEDIKVNVDDGTLSISGARRAEKQEKGLRYHRVERAYGRFTRSFSLPDEADAEKITSEFKEGILTVHLPKNPQAKAATHVIPVS